MPKVHRIHFIGIGGSGMSALAAWCLAQGISVSGSDASDSLFTQNLVKQGARVFIGHHDEHLADDTDAVIFSEAIDKTTNPEYLKAKKREFKILSYFEGLGHFFKNKKTIVVVGTHGKTTTTAMLGQALVAGGLDPTVILGSRVPQFQNRNIHIGRSDWFVVEGCEYRRSFLNFDPFGIVLLNCEPDHLDYYKDAKDYQQAFIELVLKIPVEGFLVARPATPDIQSIVKECRAPVYEVTQPVNFGLKVAGEFNRWNAAFALKAAEILGANPAKTKRALMEFTGTARRMEVKGQVKGVTIVDDYGHHPTEVKVTLKALKERFPQGKLICVFQPHQYSRTHQLLEGFKQAFFDADSVIIPNIYAARDTELDRQKIDAQKLVHEIGQIHPDVHWGKDFTTTQELLRHLVHSGDTIVTMGAGDIGEFAEILMKEF